jgi:hypothetical protein
MSEAWLYPDRYPGEEHEDRPVSRWVIGERTLPHSIVVNRHGRRFTNEGANYNDMAKALLTFDPTTFEYQNLPCWSVMDSQYRRSYPIMTVMPRDQDPDWLAKDDSLEGLASKLCIDGNGLTTTVERFNEMARAGKDEDYGRGESAYERWLGDPTTAHPNLGTIEVPPFYVAYASRRCWDEGRSSTNTKGQVLNVGRGDSRSVRSRERNAGISGPGYYGGGGTIGLAMTWVTFWAPRRTGRENARRPGRLVLNTEICYSNDARPASTVGDFVRDINNWVH